MRFRRVRDTKQAESWVKRHLGGVRHCDLDGCDIEAINDVLRYLLKLKDSYPEAAARIEVVEARDFPTSPAIAAMVAEGSLKVQDGEVTAFASSTHECVEVLRCAALRAYELARYDSRERCLVLNRRYYGDFDLLYEAVESAQSVGVTPVLDEYVPYPVVQAFSYVLLDWLSDAEQNVTVEGLSGTPIGVLLYHVKKQSSHRPESESAEDSPEDLFAELFSMYHDGPFPSDTAIRIMTLTDQITQQIREPGGDQK